MMHIERIVNQHYRTKITTNGVEKGRKLHLIPFSIKMIFALTYTKTVTFLSHHHILFRQKPPRPFILTKTDPFIVYCVTTPSHKRIDLINLIRQIMSIPHIHEK